MATFDAPTRDHCTVRRQETNTPLQALVLLNETQFVETSRVLAERVMKLSPVLQEQIVLAYRLATSLFPDEKTSQLLTELWTEENDKFRQAPDAAGELLTVGQFPADPKLDQAHLAALTVVSNLILNFDETVTKR